MGEVVGRICPTIAPRSEPGADVVCAKKRVKGEAKKKKKPLSLGMRWPVERTNSWFSNLGQLRRNTDRFSAQTLSPARGIFRGRQLHPAVSGGSVLIQRHNPLC